jgi:LPPG:FO 2-phospho-L-lactate transferase
VKGPADRLLPAVGAEVSALGVAGLYRGIASGMVIDRVDAGLASSIEALGLSVRVEDTLMKDSKIAAVLAAAVLELAGARA